MMSASDQRLPPELAAQIQESFVRILVTARTPASLCGDLKDDGAISIRVKGDDGTVARARLDLMTAACWVNTLTVLIAGARQLRGELLWRAWPDATDDDVYLVHRVDVAGVRRRFGPTRIRRPRACTACGLVVVRGALMWREENPLPYAKPNWREVRLCKACITAPLPGEERGPR